MKLAIFQGQSKVSDVESNLQKMAGVIDAAAAQGVDIIVFPELFLTGYNMKNKTSSLAELIDGPSSEIIKNSYKA
jgi:predicted amidohydrolase